MLKLIKKIMKGPEKVKIGDKYYYKIKKRSSSDCEDCAFNADIWDCLEAPGGTEYKFKEVK